MGDAIKLSDVIPSMGGKVEDDVADRFKAGYPAKCLRCGKEKLVPPAVFDMLTAFNEQLSKVGQRPLQNSEIALCDECYRNQRHALYQQEAIAAAEAAMNKPGQASRSDIQAVDGFNRRRRDE